MDSKTIEWMGTRVDRARELTNKLAALEDKKKHFTTGDMPLRVECGSQVMRFSSPDRPHVELRQALARILDAQIAEAQAELDAL